MQTIKVGKEDWGYYIAVSDKKSNLEGMSKSTVLKRIRSLAKKYPGAEFVVSTDPVSCGSESEIKALLAEAGL